MDCNTEVRVVEETSVSLQTAADAIAQQLADNSELEGIQMLQLEEILSKLREQQNRTE